MKFPNAYNGVSKIFLAEILSILAAILAIIGGTMVLTGVDTSNLNQEVTVSGVTVGGGIFILLTCIVALVSFILYIMGLSRAGKDEASFKSALTAVLVGLIASLVGGIFGNNLFVYTFASVVSKFCELIAFFFCIGGICNLATALENKEIVDKTMSMMKLICAILIISAILIIVTAFAPVTNVVSGILSIVGSICSIVAYIMYLIILSNAKGMLAAR